MSIRRLVSFTLSVAVLAFACSKQGEGDRCTSINDNDVCDDGLTCQGPSGANACGSDKADFNCKPYRCCYPAPQKPTNSRCEGYSTPPPSSGTGGADAGVSFATGGTTSTGNGTTSTGGDGSSNGGTGATTGGTTSAGGTDATGGDTTASTT